MQAYLNEDTLSMVKVVGKTHYGFRKYAVEFVMQCYRQVSGGCCSGTHGPSET
jgi:hypothetical protein